MNIAEIAKSILFGVVEGITEWLPISSTGHMILLNEIVPLNVSDEFLSMFLIVIQLGAILAVVFLFWKKIFPFEKVQGTGVVLKQGVVSLWGKILIACIPAAIVGLLFEERIEELFYNYTTVVLALIVFGIIFILIENKNRPTRVHSLNDISIRDAFMVGLFQVVAALFPGTSRSGATIIGGLSLGLSRTVAAEFTFLLAIPVMFGASALKLVGFGLSFTSDEILILALGMITAFVVSMGVISFLMEYIKKNTFKVFGWYRIILGVVVFSYFSFF